MNSKLKTVYYEVWSENSFTNIIVDIQILQPDRIILFCAQEWEPGYIFHNSLVVEKFEKLLEKYEVELILVLGTHPGWDGFYENYKGVPKVNTEIIFWPSYFCFHAYHFLKKAKIHFSSDDYIPDSTRAEKLFTSLNNKTHYHRCVLQDELSRQDVLQYGDYSWIDYEESLQFDWKYWTPKFTTLDHKYVEELDSYTTVPQRYTENLLNLIPETTPLVPFLTEKTWMAIFAGQPTVVFGSKDTAKVLGELGFLPYEELVDYSYDSIYSTEERAAHLVDSLKKLTDRDWIELKKTLLTKTQHNRERAVHIATSGKYIPPRLIEILDQDTYENIPYWIRFCSLDQIHT